MTEMFTKKIHVFRAGDQTSAQGVQRNFSEKDLQQVVDTYDPSIHEAPLVIGHQGDSDSLPSFGWIKGFSRQGENLYADVEFTDTAKDLVKDGHYRKVSISFYSPDSAINPNPGKWSARHLALLGAAPPAVKGLEPFSFREEDGVFDYATALDPSQIFDEELGPTVIVERSPLEMLKERLDSVRNDMKSAVKDLQENQENQTEEESSNPEADAKPPAEVDSPADGGNDEEDDTQQFTEIVQQTADLEDKFPEEQFMDHSNKISRKRASGAHGQVMQVVENVYEEQHGEMPEAFKKNAAKMKAKAKGGNIEDESADHAEEEGRYDTARSGQDSYGSRMKTGKAGGKSVGSDRMKTASSGAQDADRMHHAEDGEQEADRKRTAKDGSDNAMGEARWDAQSKAKSRHENNDQYDADEDSYGVNDPKTADGSNPAGREDSMTKVPTETEESPDNTVFAVNTKNVMSDKDMRVKQIKSSDGRQAVKGGAIDHAEEGRRKQLSGDFEGDVNEIVGPDGAYAEVPRGEKKAKDRQLVPGAMDEADVADETVGPDGAYSEGDEIEEEDFRQCISPKGDVYGTKGNCKPPNRPVSGNMLVDKGVERDLVGGVGRNLERKHRKNRAIGEALSRGDIGDAARAWITNTQNFDEDFAEDNLSGEFEGGPNQKTKRSGGVFSEEHKELPNPMTKTGKGSTYTAESADEDEDEYNEFSTDHCGMNYGMGSMGQAKPMGMEAMFEELAALKRENERMKREYQEAKMNMRREKMASFVESLYDCGKLTDGIMPQDELLHYCEGLEFGTLEFSEGETPATKLLGLLNRLPNMVEYGEVVQGGSFQYAEEDLDPHAKALRIVEAEGVDYVEALKKAMYS